MAKHATEEQIKNLSADYIYQQAIGSLLLLLLSAMEEEEMGVSALPYEIPQDLAEIRKEIRQYLLRLEDLLENNDQERTLALAECLELKKRLLSIYEIVFSYFSQWNIVSTNISDQITLRKYTEDGVAQKQVEWSLFFADCHAFIESAQTAQEKSNYMGQLLKCVPIFMTRDKYYANVKQCLNTAFAEESKEFMDKSLQTFEGFCCPESNALYGKYFTEIAEELGKKRMLLPHKLTNEELAVSFEEMNGLLESLEDIEEYFSCILHDINSLILLFYLTYTFEDLTQKDVAYSDLYHSVCDFFGGEWNSTEKAAYLDTLNEQLEKAVEPVIDKATEIGHKEYDLLQKIGSFEDFSEDTKKVLMTEDFIRDCFFGNLNDELFRFDLPQDLPLATQEEKNILIDDFIAKTRNSFDTLPVQTRKIAMQTLLSALPPVGTVQDIMDCIMEAIDNVSTDEQRILIVDKVGTVFADNGYESIAAPEDDPNDDGSSNHHHHHDCDCGHDHHHHH
ncbi:hypothetical protein CLNEO_23050 [Anaerotignum neopropionicum]|uniref:TerB-C domain-containing protein n=1 Tax=Anaerotignum neopropionicum TaxID=36847 RepID=A0A136WCZ5_9FIRM|nr:hypothetical protein [Anaerotignum neopropionicum]KXL52371.1 hypothetical protein CLNEO_23050 [Anaerotignum neopropionicum]